MSTKLLALTALAVAAAALTSAAAAGPSATRQRVAITAKKGDVHSFVLTALTRGLVASDSGTMTDCCWTERVVVRNGQKIESNDPLLTFTGKRGTFVYRARIEWVDAGNGYGIGTGTWKIVRGTGAYKRLKGSGRTAGSWPSEGLVSWRAEGYFRLT